jgi:hypothetical protein
MKDLDEVRIGALKHLADFLKVLFHPHGLALCCCVIFLYLIFLCYWLLIRLYAVVLL